MGSCVSVLQRNSDSAISSKRNKVLNIPSHTKANPIKFNRPISAGISFKPQPSVARAATTSFKDPDSTEAAAFESQLAWFDLSECEDDFLSANGDSIVSSATSTTHPGSSCICSISRMSNPRPNGTRLADGSPDCSGEVVEHYTILPNKQVKLIEFLQDGFWSDKAKQNYKAKQNSKPRSVDLPLEIKNRISDVGLESGRTSNSRKRRQ